MFFALNVPFKNDIKHKGNNMQYKVSIKRLTSKLLIFLKNTAVSTISIHKQQQQTVISDLFASIFQICLSVASVAPEQLLNTLLEG